MRFTPISQRAAKDWITATHRHLPAPVGDLYRVGLEIDGRLVAVGVAGRPCRMLQDGRTAELTRIASAAPVAVNACSRLYAALRRAGHCMGYARYVTYTLPGEPGTSLRAAGFHFDGLTDGGEWSRPSRPRCRRSVRPKMPVDFSRARQWSVGWLEPGTPIPTSKLLGKEHIAMSTTRKLRLGPLPSHASVKLTFTCPADLKADLERYAAMHSQLYGEEVDAATLAPHMLAWFLKNDRGFRRS